MAYADDVVILSSGKFIETVSERMQIAIRILEKWVKGCDLSVNPTKTEVVLFTRRRRIPEYRLPILGGSRLILTGEVKYLGVILDSKLTWKRNIEERE